MNDVRHSPEMGAQMRASSHSLDGEAGGTVALLTNLAGAALSLALIGGVCVWGYKLMVRDVSGIPIVRAAEGDMRILPADPGGQVARNTGLSVNAVVAAGEAGGPVEQVTLAPPPISLRPEDAPPPVVQPPVLGSADAFLERAVHRRMDLPGAAPERVASGEIDALVAGLLTQGDAATPVAAQTQAAAGRSGVDADATDAPAARAQLVAIDAPGPRQSIRPRLRPASEGLVQKAAFAPEPARAEIDPDAIPSGTRLAQLGAFDSPEVARSEWLRLEQRLGSVLAQKSRVVQKVTSNGRDFYRLRAMGFRDLNDARRFCSALKAEGVDCIPVAAR